MMLREILTSPDVGIVLRINTHTKAERGDFGCLVGEDVITFPLENTLKGEANCFL